MEIEYKWDMADPELAHTMVSSEFLADAIVSQREIRMQAIYFDTAASDVYAMHGGLRIRRENETSVCCLKMSAESLEACKTRREFEVVADNIEDGLIKLPQAGAPQEVCDRLLAGKPLPICETVFTRQACKLEFENCNAELAFDWGEMRRNGKVAPIHEIELEYVSGSQESFHALAAGLEEQFALIVQPLSKLARAMSL